MVGPICRPVNCSRLLGQSGQELLGALEGGAEGDGPLLQADLVRVGEHDLALLCPEDDALLVFHLQFFKTIFMRLSTDTWQINLGKAKTT